MFSCTDNLKLEETDLKKYSWLTPFVCKAVKEFKGEHNMDSGGMKFSYKPPGELQNLSCFDSIADVGKWTIKNISPFEKSYSKFIEEIPARKETVITIRLDTTNHRIHYIVD